MIVGIGCDIVRVSRMSKIVPVFKKGMQQHILSSYEQEELDAEKANDDKISRFLAKRFAAKEAFSKALGTGIVGFERKDGFIENNSDGKPFLKVQKSFYLKNLNYYSNII